MCKLPRETVRVWLKIYGKWYVKKYLDIPIAEKMINSSITSHTDYCNHLLYGANGYIVFQLQLCRKNADRVLSDAAQVLSYHSTTNRTIILASCWTNSWIQNVPAFHIKALHTTSCCLCTLEIGPCDQRPNNSSSKFQGADWHGVANAALPMLLPRFGTLSLHLLNSPLPLMPPGAARKLMF